MLTPYSPKLVCTGRQWWPVWAAVRGGVGVACRTGGRQYWPTPWPSAVVASVRVAGVLAGGPCRWCPSAVLAVGPWWCPSVAVVAVFVAAGGLSAVRWSIGPPWSFRGPWRPVFGPCQWWAVAARGWLVCLPFQYWNRAADQWPPSGWAVVGACRALRAWCGWPCRRCWLAQWVARTDTGGPWSLLAGRTDTAAVGGVVRVRWSLVRGGPCWAVWRPCGPSVVSLYLVALSWPVWALFWALPVVGQSVALRRPCWRPSGGGWCPSVGPCGPCWARCPCLARGVLSSFSMSAPPVAGRCCWSVLAGRVTGWLVGVLVGGPCWCRASGGRGPSVYQRTKHQRGRGGLAGGVGGGYSAAVVSLL